jgi:uncharacterized membrane protein
MAQTESRPTDEQVERFMGNLLRAGVLAAAAVVLAGGLVYLIRHGTEPADLRAFRGEPEDLRTISGIVNEALVLRGRGLIQLGLLFLIATPVARVVFSVVAFRRQRDWVYVGITLLVLAVLAFSLLSGSAEGGR